MSRRRLVYSFLIVVFVLFLSTPVFGAGFALYEGSARGNVLGAGLTATADDPSAVFYNPAGITQLKGTQVMLGATFIAPMTDVKTTSGGVQTTTETEGNVWIPPHGYITTQLSEKWWAGLGMFSRFGLGTEFEATWPGRYNSYNAVIKTFEINPNIAYKVNDKFSIAGGLDLMYFSLHLQSKVSPATFGAPAILGDADSDLKGNSWGYGFNLAVHFKPSEDWSLGASYRSRVSQHVSGDANFTKPAAWAAIGAANAVLLRSTTASGKLHLPDEVFAGIAWKATPTVTLGGGVIWTRWSSYDKLQLNYDIPIAPGVAQVTKQKQWVDVYRFTVGAEWKVTPNWDLRLGYAYDQEPIQDQYADYLIPANDRNMFSAGFGWHNAKWSADFSYTLIVISPRTIPARAADGILASEFQNGLAHLFGVSLGYKF
jgi:long-chain fatty acid transport protein